MFLSHRTKKKEIAAETGTISVYSGGFGVRGEGESRGVGLSCPGGYLWRPALGQRVLVIKTGEQPAQPVIVSAEAASEPEGFSPGEAYIFSKEASVYIKNDGCIVLKGDVEIEGSLMVNGMMYRPCSCI